MSSLSKKKHAAKASSTSEEKFEEPTSTSDRKKRGMGEDKNISDDSGNGKRNKRDEMTKVMRVSISKRLIYYSQLCGYDRWQFESWEEEFEFQDRFEIQADDRVCYSQQTGFPQPGIDDYFLLEEQIYEDIVSKRKNVSKRRRTYWVLKVCSVDWENITSTHYFFFSNAVNAISTSSFSSSFLFLQFSPYCFSIYLFLFLLHAFLFLIHLFG